jgi:hypothetical protein
MHVSFLWFQRARAMKLWCPHNKWNVLYLPSLVNGDCTGMYSAGRLLYTRTQCSAGWSPLIATMSMSMNNRSMSMYVSVTRARVRVRCRSVAIDKDVLLADAGWRVNMNRNAARTQDLSNTFRWLRASRALGAVRSLGYGMVMYVAMPVHASRA